MARCLSERTYEALSLYESGIGPSEIGRRLGLTKQGVSILVKRHGLKKRYSRMGVINIPYIVSRINYHRATANRLEKVLDELRVKADILGVKILIKIIKEELK